ncbi:phage tail protein, partial [Cytobacillus kochii]|uniref:phage tail protein n=1 Tax=Cytobacillus kochii TaxID=859143 RepID=UPI001CD3ED2F
MINLGQPTIIIKNLKGQEYPAIAEVNRKRRVNGQRELSLSFLYTEINKDFIHDIEFGWKILFEGEWYTITHPGYSTDGDFISVGITAILSFFVDLNGYYLQDKVENKSYTPGAYFREIFNGTPYNFVLVDTLYANTLSFEDNQSKTGRFLYGIDRFSGEYIVRQKNVYIYNQIGSDKDVILHEDLNISSVRLEIDASGFHTWAKGYGDLPDSTEIDREPEYQLKVEYRSPLIAKYGEIEGPALKDGNYKSSESLIEAVKKQVEKSYSISTEIDAVDLTNNGYPEMILDEGDRVWLYVSKLNLNQQVRVMEVEETFDWEGNRINVRYTLGNEGIASRYKTQQYDTIKDFNDILSGRKKLAFNWLPEAIKRASEII